MNNFLQRVHQWDTGAFLWLHVTRNIGYRKSVRWISHSGDGYGYALIALALLSRSEINLPHKRDNYGI